MVALACMLLRQSRQHISMCILRATFTSIGVLWHWPSVPSRHNASASRQYDVTAALCVLLQLPCKRPPSLLWLNAQPAAAQPARSDGSDGKPAAAGGGRLRWAAHGPPGQRCSQQASLQSGVERPWPASTSRAAVAREILKTLSLLLFAVLYFIQIGNDRPKFKEILYSPCSYLGLQSDGLCLLL